MVRLFRRSSRTIESAAPNPTAGLPPTAPAAPAQITPSGPAAPALAALSGPARWEAGFPMLAGAGSPAARLPWRLPEEPALAGIAADAVTVGALTVLAASIVGPSHRCEEPATPRQDAYRLGRDRRRRHLLVAVADGMSDSSGSHLGANVAVAAVVARLRDDLDTDAELDAAAIFLDAARQMAGTAERHRLRDDDVRAAVLAAVIPVSADADGRRSVWLAGVADVGAWLREPAGWRQVAGAGKAEYDGGRLAEFLPYHPDRATTVRVELEPGAVLALATDGIGDGLADDGIGAWFSAHWADPPHISSFLDTVGYEARGRLDDRTAVVVWCDR